MREQGVLSCLPGSRQKLGGKRAVGIFCWRVPLLHVLRCFKSCLRPLSRELLLGSSEEALHYTRRPKVLTVLLFVPQGGGCALMTRSNKFEQIVRGMNSVSWSACRQREMSRWSRLLPQPGLSLPFFQVLDVPLTVKIRTGVQEKINVAHKIIPKIREWGASMVTVQGYLLWRGIFGWCLGNSACMSA